MSEAPVPGVDDLLLRWRTLRRLTRELEVAGHPDLIDGRGRRWTWKSDDLYRHDTFAWPRCLLPEPVTLAEAA